MFQYFSLRGDREWSNLQCFHSQGNFLILKKFKPFKEGYKEMKIVRKIL